MSFVKHQVYQCAANHRSQFAVITEGKAMHRKLLLGMEGLFDPKRQMVAIPNFNAIWRGWHACWIDTFHSQKTLFTSSRLWTGLTVFGGAHPESWSCRATGQPKAS
jgi:hypothetical protein